MPRRAIRKPKTDLDLSRHFKEQESLPTPWDAAALFERDLPLEVEVGSGKGLFIVNAAANQSERNFLGIELAQKYAQYSGTKLAARGLTNAVLVHGDGLKIFRELFPTAALAAVHVYFPDPWWKARHKKRRVLNAPFLRDVERTLLPGGSLHFWTDVEEYFRTTLELIAQVTTLEGPLSVPETPALHELDYRTHFERRTRLNSEAVYRAEFRKPAE